MKVNVYVFSRKKLGRLLDIKLYGSITQIVENEKIEINGRNQGYITLIRLLGEDKFFENKDYYIKKCVLTRGTFKKSK